MVGKKILLANVLHSINLLNLFKRLPLKNKLVVLNYHRVRPDRSDFTPVFDDGVYTIDANQFALQVRWLKKNTRIYSERELAAAIYGDEPLTAGTVITFDDGYRDNYSLAFDILKAFGVPAIFFIPTKLIETRQVGWWDIIAYLVKNSPKSSVTYHTRTFLFPESRNDAVTFFLEKMKVEPYEKTRHLLEDLSDLLAVDLPDAKAQDAQLMTWDHIREMAGSGMAMGAHSHSHRVLATLDALAQKEEMVLSKLILEKVLGKPVISIAYPVGGPNHYTVETQTLAEQCGYRLGFTAGTGVNTLHISDPYAIRRVNDLLEDVRTVSAFVILPEVFLWERAAETHKRVLTAHPDYADFSYRMGLIHLGQGKLEKAAGAFSDALANNPDYAEARIKLAITLAHSGDLSAAAAHLSRVVEQHPNYADVHYLLGAALAADNRLTEAMVHFNRSVEINPAYRDARIKLGILQCRIGNFASGIETLSAALAGDPDNMELRHAVTVGRRLLSETEDGEPDQRIVTALTEALFGGEDRKRETPAEFLNHIEISPNLTDMLAIIATYAEGDDAPAALAPIIEDYMSQYPGYADLRNVYGLVHLKSGRLDVAEAAFRKALDISPAYFKARLNLFHTLFRQEKWEEALAEGQRLAEAGRPYPDVYTDLADVQHRLSMPDEAAATLQRALDIRPEFPPARKLLKRMTSSDQTGK